MISTHLKRFRLTILGAVALLAIIGAVVALPDSTEAGRKPLYITSVDMTITPTADATRDNKEVDMSFTWGAPSRATGYKIDRRHRGSTSRTHLLVKPNGRSGKRRNIYHIRTDVRLSRRLTPSTEPAHRWNGE